MALTDITASAVVQAIEEFDRRGRDAFLETHGFGRARRYLLEHDGKFYDSKAIAGVAHGYLAGQEVLESGEFSGGEGHAVSVLRDLGFRVVDEPDGRP
ncbi:hypothetical protein SGFS_025600 [Streptomyces graminofaciens]|jgi:5-methylcytosine-specific restriction protein A|uniref:ScoMcrA-like N-terminal head domain-containing protein n=1 Tax=Streptomyces graminofaciens TaxID=68212 RepID=A0ABM7F5T5_9ACTN|nr:hypothetical protein [Streptomyces graminofaciens]BBC31266.1 hypothetical protein SGFS_025600 [Streptomyces graminofaciens]